MPEIKNEISSYSPNADTLAAMAEFDEISSRPEKFKKYSSFSELLRDVEPDA